jgi:hypothetical protein
MAYTTEDTKVLMKEVFDPRVRMYFNYVARAWRLIPDGDAKNMNARGAEFSAKVEGNPDGTYYPEGGRLPVGDGGKNIRLVILYTAFAHAGKLTGLAIRSDSKDAMTDALQDRIEDDMKMSIKLLSEDMWQDGKGTKATVLTGGSALNVVRMTAPLGARLIRPRGKYDVVEPVTATVRNAAPLHCKSVNQATGDVTWNVGETVTVVAGDVVVPSGSFGLAIHGFPYHVDDQNTIWQGKLRSDFPSQLKSLVYDAATAALSVALLDSMEAKQTYVVGLENSLGKITYMSSVSQVQAYRSLGYNAANNVVKVFAGTDKVLDFGYEKVTHNGHDWFIDNDCRDTDLYMVRLETFQKYFITPLTILSTDGNTVRILPDVDANGDMSFVDQYVYHHIMEGDVGNDNPQANMRIKNLAAPINGMF